MPEPRPPCRSRSRLAAGPPGAAALAVLLAAALVLPACRPGEEGPTAGDESGAYHEEGLGTVTFPTSGEGEAREHFLRGVLYLHSFEYDDAREAFRRAREADPDFVMAHWGEAMTHNHPLWRQQDREAARAVLERLGSTREERLAAAPTEREKAYLEAVEVLYGEAPKTRRDTLYSRAMERLAARFPEDAEARAFYALSVLGLNQGDRDVPTFMRAGAIALDLFGEHPRHPGAAHYAIHSFDDPTHAPLGLEAARAYADIAPRAAHARHMTSHIFLALGMWDRVVEANEAAARTTAREAGLERELHPCGHYAEWLSYGYLQRGRPSAAAELIRACHALSREGGEGGSPGSVARMRAHYLVDAEEGDDAVARIELEPEDVGPRWRLALWYGNGVAAARRGRVGAALEAAAALQEAAGSLREGLAADARVMALSMRALLQRHGGEAAATAEAARRAAELEAQQPVPYGPPSTYKPPRELAGEALLELGRAEEARAEFRRALERTPRRSRSLLGLARAAAKTGRTEEAAGAYAELAEMWENAEAGWEGVAEARSYLEEHGRPAGTDGGALP